MKMDKQTIAEEMSKYYFFKYYISHKYKEDDMVQGMSYEQREQYFKSAYSHQNGFRDRNYKYFLKTAEMFSDREEFSEAKHFIDSVMAENFLFPTQLPYEKNWKVFLRNSQESELTHCSVIDEVKKAKEFFTYLNGRSIKDMVNSVIFSKEWIEAYAEDTLDLTVLCFSKSFMEFSKKENMIIDFHEEQSKIDERLKNKIKEKIGEDFMEA